MTRLVWVIIFALFIGVLAYFTLRSLSGTRANPQLAQIVQAHDILSRRFADSRFRIQFSTPHPGVRNLVVTIQPGPADSASVAAQTDSAESIVRRTVDLSRYDSLVVAVFDRVYRTVPVR